MNAPEPLARLRHGGSQMFIYVIAGDGHSKIGISCDPKRRLRGLQSANARPLRLIFTRQVDADDVDAVEAAAHTILGKGGKRRRGEWFKASPERAIAAIEEAVAAAWA